MITLGSLLGTVLPWVLVVALAIVAAVALLLLRRAERRTRSAERALSEAAGPDPRVAEFERRRRIAHDGLVGTASALSAVIDRADAIPLTLEQDAAAAGRSAAELAEQLRVVRDDVRRMADVVAPAEARDAAVEPSALAVGPLVPTAGALATSMTQLVVRARDAGLDVRVRTVGEPFEVPGSLAVAAMRIVELALDNAAAHAGPGARAIVTATWTDDALRIEVEDDGVRAAARREGRDPDDPAPAGDEERLAQLTGLDGPGIAELRERAEAFGGVFSAVPVPGIGVTVTATFPGVRRGQP